MRRVLLRFRGLRDLLLKMKLKNSSSIRLRDGHQIIFDLDLFARFWQMAQELDYVTANGRDFRIFQLEVGQLL